MDSGHINAAIKSAVIYYKIDMHGASATYDKDLDSGGETPDAEHVKIGSTGLGISGQRSAGYLGSILFHESIHVEQFVEKRHYESNIFPFGNTGYELNELEAYDRELAEPANRFILTKDEIASIKQARAEQAGLITHEPKFWAQVYPHGEENGYQPDNSYTLNNVCYGETTGISVCSTPTPPAE